MQEFNGSKQLPHDVLFVHVLKDICPDDCMQVCFHEVEDQVNIPVVLCLVDRTQPARHAVHTQ